MCSDVPTQQLECFQTVVSHLALRNLIYDFLSSNKKQKVLISKIDRIFFCRPNFRSKTFEIRDVSRYMSSSLAPLRCYFWLNWIISNNKRCPIFRRLFTTWSRLLKLQPLATIIRSEHQFCDLLCSHIVTLNAVRFWSGQLLFQPSASALTNKSFQKMR